MKQAKEMMTMSLFYKCDKCGKSYDSIPEFKYTNANETIMILCNAYKSDSNEKSGFDVTHLCQHCTEFILEGSIKDVPF